MRKIVSLVGAVAAACLASTAASAAPVTINFTGTVSSIPSNLVASPVSIGGPISGSFTFDDSATSGSSSSSGSLFPYLAAQITLAGQTLVSPATLGSILVGNDRGGFDNFTFNANGASGSNVINFGLNTQGPTTLFSAETLAQLIALAGSGDLSALTSRFIQILVASNDSPGPLGTCASFGAGCLILSRLDTLSLAPPNEIPVPAALPLFLAGLAGLRFARRRPAA